MSWNSTSKMRGPYLVRVETAPISIGHCLVSLSLSFRDRNHIDRSSFVSVGVFKVAPISIGHHPTSLCLVWVGTTPISIGHSSCQFSFWSRTYIDRSSSMSVWVYFEFLGSHLYRSVIFLSVCVQFELGPHVYWSIIYLVSSISVLGPHLYRSTIFLSVCVQFEF